MGNLIGGKDDKMSYKFKITRGNAILNFSEEYCQSRCELIESESFARVLKGYIHDIKRKKTTAYEYLREVQKESIDIVDDLRTVFRLLLVMDPKELASIYPKFAPYFRDMDEFTQVIEDIYLFWRRYNVIVWFITKNQEGDIKTFNSLMHKLTLKRLFYQYIDQLKINVLDKVKMFYVKLLQVSMQGYVFQICVHFYHMNIVV